MKIRKDVELAWNILIHSKLRSWLTILGIVIGIGAVVAIVSVSQGAQASLEDQLSGLGAEIITVSSGYSRAMGFGGGGPGGEGGSSSSDVDPLTSNNLNALRTVSNIEYVMGTVSDKAEVVAKSKSADMTVEGVDPKVWEEFNDYDLDEGRILMSSDKYAALIGSRVVSTFDDEIGVGSQISIEGQSFRIVGILESQGGMGGNDNSIVIPYDVAVNILDDKKNKEYDSISLKMADIELADETLDAVEAKLMLSRGILFEEDKDFTVSSSASMQETMSSTLTAMSWFLGGIAAISLLVGAVGIANTMFTSVLEKTRDIGILKAIGTRNKDVLAIFLFNSGLIGLVGGIGGVVLGWIASTAITTLIGLSTSTGSAGRGGMMSNMFSSSQVSLTLILFALFFSMIIGMIAGAIPAWRASRLKPVDALRYE